LRVEGVGLKVERLTNPCEGSWMAMAF